MYVCTPEYVCMYVCMHGREQSQALGIYPDHQITLGPRHPLCFQTRATMMIDTVFLC